MRVAIIINEQRNLGLQRDDAKLEAAAVEYHISYQFFISKSEDLENTFNKIIAEGYEAIIVGGGDGTVRTIAQLAVKHPIPLAILPLGTFNIFAKQLAFPNDLIELFKIINRNKIKMVDVGLLNDYVFLNHSSIGFYSHILKLRKKHKAILGKSKLLKIMFTLLNFFKVLPIYQLEVKVDEKLLTIKTCFIFIGNNYHDTDLFHFGNRASLTSGIVSIYILKCKNRWEVFKCIMATLFKHFNEEKYLSQYSVENVRINAESKSINTVIDGDLFRLETPLCYTILNKKLPVFSVDE
jgi:diacylglycerol kinase family enzyme